MVLQWNSLGAEAWLKETAADGSYLFDSVSSLGSGQAYEVLYINDAGNDDYLSVWYGPLIQGYTADSRRSGGDFDIADVTLGDPQHTSSLPLPVTFTWQTRGRAGDHTGGFCSRWEPTSCGKRGI